MDKTFLKYNNLLFSQDFLINDQIINLSEFIEQNNLPYFLVPKATYFIKKCAELYENKKVKIMITLLTKEGNKINFEIRGKQNIENLEKKQISSFTEEKTQLFQEEFKFFLNKKEAL